MFRNIHETNRPYVNGVAIIFACDLCLNWYIGNWFLIGLCFLFLACDKYSGDLSGDKDGE